MSNRPKETRRRLPWIGLVVVVFSVITVSWVQGWGKAGIGIAAILVALWDAQN
jgi:hypothetical protein